MLTSTVLYMIVSLIFFHLKVIAKCPDRCNCTMTEIVDCSDTLMNMFPVGDWKLMNMSHNAIHSIKSYSIRDNFLEVIDISNNLIEIVDGSAFMGMLRLKEIDISGNNISYIYPETFLFTPNLVSLSLANNRLLDLQNGLMFSGSSLKILDVAYCNISRVDETTLAHGVSGLKELYLQHNSITYISRGSFSTLKSLKILNIGYNKLQSMEIDIFLPMIALIELRLEENPVFCNCELGDIYLWCHRQKITLENMSCVSTEGNHNVDWSTRSHIVNCNYSYEKRVMQAREDRLDNEESDTEHSDGPSPVVIAVIALVVIVIVIAVCVSLLNRGHDCCGALGCGLICIECLR